LELALTSPQYSCLEEFGIGGRNCKRIPWALANTAASPPTIQSPPPPFSFESSTPLPIVPLHFAKKKTAGSGGDRGREIEGGRLRCRWSPSPPPTPSPPQVCCVRPSSSCSCISGKPPPFSLLTSTPSRSQTAREKGLQERPLLPAGAASPASTSPSFPQVRLRRPQSPPPLPLICLIGTLTLICCLDFPGTFTPTSELGCCFGRLKVCEALMCLVVCPDVFLAVFYFFFVS